MTAPAKPQDRLVPVIASSTPWTNPSKSCVYFWYLSLGGPICLFLDKRPDTREHADLKVSEECSRLAVAHLSRILRKNTSKPVIPKLWDGCHYQHMVSFRCGTQVGTQIAIGHVLVTLLLFTPYLQNLWKPAPKQSYLQLHY